MGTQTGRKIKYGQVAGPLVTRKYPVAASQVLKHLGGAFVKLDSNQRLDLADSGDAEIKGWMFAGEYTTSATAGLYDLVVNISLDALYRIPTDATQTLAQLKALVGKTCDLIVTSDIQYADIGESSEDVIIIEDYEYYDANSGGQAVIVRVNPNKVGATGVA